MAPLVRNLGARLRLAVSFTFRPDYILKKNRTLGGTREVLDGFGKEKSLLPLPGMELRTVHPVVSLLPATRPF